MSCITASLSRIGGITSSAELIGGNIECNAKRIGGGEVLLERIGAIFVLLFKEGSISVEAIDVTDMTASLSEVCTTNIRPPYLEINPVIIWVYPDVETDNDVLSNTRWNVN